MNYQITTSKDIDNVKRKTASSMGWRIYRFDSDMIKNGDAKCFLETVL